MSEDSPVKWSEISDPQALPPHPLVSVHMITYNHEPYIAEAIEGVLGQKTEFPIELVIGEDCSTDNTRAIVIEYQRKYPQLIRLLLPSRNAGAIANGKAVVRACRGEYVAFCEGDDYWVNPNKLQMQAEFLDTHPDYGAAHGDINYLAKGFGRWRQTNAVKRTSSAQIPEGYIHEYVLRRMFIHTCTLCLTKHAMDHFLGSRYAERQYTVLDWPLMIFVSRYYKVHYCDEVLATYRRTPDSIMNSGPSTTLPANH